MKIATFWLLLFTFIVLWESFNASPLPILSCLGACLGGGKAASSTKLTKSQSNDYTLMKSLFDEIFIKNNKLANLNEVEQYFIEHKNYEENKGIKADYEKKLKVYNPRINKEDRRLIRVYSEYQLNEPELSQTLQKIPEVPRIVFRTTNLTPEFIKALIQGKQIPLKGMLLIHPEVERIAAIKPMVATSLYGLTYDHRDDAPFRLVIKSEGCHFIAPFAGKYVDMAECVITRGTFTFLKSEITSVKVGSEMKAKQTFFFVHTF